MAITHSTVADGSPLIGADGWNADHVGGHDPVTVGTGLDVTGQLVELDLSEVAAGGELGGFMDAPTVDATHAGSTHSAATDTHIGDTADAHDASAISFTPNGSIAATDVQAAIAEVRDEAGGPNPSDPLNDWAAEAVVALGYRIAVTITDVGVAVYQVVVAGTTDVAPPAWDDLYPAVGRVLDATAMWVLVGWVGGLAKDSRGVGLAVAFDALGRADATTNAYGIDTAAAVAGATARATGSGSAATLSQARADGDGDADANIEAATFGAGTASARALATANGTGSANARAQAESNGDGDGDATAGSKAIVSGAGNSGIASAMNEAVADADSQGASAGFSAIHDGVEISLRATVSAGLAQLVLTGIPTSDPHVVGALYTAAGVLMVSAG